MNSPNPKAINGSILNRAVLVLNANYIPLAVCTAKREICLSVLDKVDILVNYDSKVHSPSVSLPLPSIVKVKEFIHYNSLNVEISRKNIILRDNHICQYCGTKKGPITVDHIMPKVRGGKDTWDNLITACQPCNQKKGDRTPDEIGMHILKQPKKPSRIHYYQQYVNTLQSDWKPYLFMESFN